jgi:DNA-binding GntR family transcriptional regulator
MTRRLDRRDAEASTAERSPESATLKSAEPLYVRFARIVQRSIEAGTLQEGTVLLEGRLAELLNSGRAPVRQALAKVHETGLTQRFEGRGFIIGKSPTEVRRIRLTPEMLVLDEVNEPLRRSFGWERIYDEVERTIIHRSVFGRYRVSEPKLARQFEVGRTVARDVLNRLQTLGILDKDERQRWTIVPLDGYRLSNLYTVRELLEPAALHDASELVDAADVAEMRDNAGFLLAKYPNVSARDMNDLEFDLHVRLLGHCSNPEILSALRHTRCTLTLSKHLLGVELDVPPHDPFMEEHIQVLDALLAGKRKAGMEALRRHIRSSCPKVIERLEYFRDSFAPPDIDYIEK